MKSLYITFTDAEFKKLLKVKANYLKGNLNWHQFIIAAANAYEREREKNGSE